MMVKEECSTVYKRYETNYEETNKNVTTDLQRKVTTKFRSQDL